MAAICCESLTPIRSLCFIREFAHRAVRECAHLAGRGRTRSNARHLAVGEFGGVVACPWGVLDPSDGDCCGTLIKDLGYHC